MQYSAKKIQDEWNSDTRWENVQRDWTPEKVVKLRGTFPIAHSIAEWAAFQLWSDLKTKGVRALGASTPAQAVQMALAGLRGIYVSGWQVAADVNGDMYPDQSLYPCDRVPVLVKAINNALMRQDQIDSTTGKDRVENWLIPLIADCEAGFGGALNAYEITKKMIEAGAAAVHFEDQLSSEKKCGHLGGKVLVPTGEMINKLKAARLAADVCGTPTVIIARTDANSAKLLTSTIDKRDDRFLMVDGHYAEGVPRTDEGFYYIYGGLDMAIARGLAYAPYADLLWCETKTPSLEEAKKFADGIHEKYPDQMLAYNCSPSFNWLANLSPVEVANFQDELFKMGYKFQFITLAGFHSLNYGMFKLATEYKTRHMQAYAELQELEFGRQEDGYDAVKHQGFVGTGYFDEIKNVITGGSETLAMSESTEAEQF